MEPIMAITTAVLAVAVVVLLVLFCAALVRGSRARRARDHAESRMLDLELALAEQTDRLRIAGELSGLSAASLSSLSSEADAVRRLAETDSAAASRAAATLFESSRSALADLRRAADIAHEGEIEAADLEVQPDLEELSLLAVSAAERGVDVVVQQTGERLPLKAGAELAIFRIVQEAVSNAAEHGGQGTTVKVSLRWTESGVQLLADDDGVRAAARRSGQDPNEAVSQGYTREDDLAALTGTPTGRGISEMRSRTELYGGVFSATSVPGVGFSISAIFPALLHHNGIHGVKL